MAVLAAGGLFAASHSGGMRALHLPRPSFEQVAVGLGLGIAQVAVEGHRQTSDRAIYAALGLRSGMTMLDFSLAEARARIERLPWVKRAVVERSIPNGLTVRVSERQPAALWTRHDGSYLIDAEGHLLARANAASKLPALTIAGEQAGQRTPEALRLAGAARRAGYKVSSLHLVGGRRWDARLASGVVVQLPADRPEQALRRLLALDQLHGLSTSGLSTIDLRLPHRVVVYRDGQPVTGRVTSRGRQTETAIARERG